MHIANGITADAGWTKQLAWSVDGSAWNSINKSDLTVHQNIVNKNLNSPLVSRSKSYIITLKYNGNQVLQFDIQDVANQAGWTNDPAGLKQAVDDLSTWIAL